MSGIDGDGLAAAHSGGRGSAVAAGLGVGGVDAPAGAAAARGRVGRGGVAAAGRPQPRPGLARGDDAGAFRAGRDCTPPSSTDKPGPQTRQSACAESVGAHRSAVGDKSRPRTCRPPYSDARPAGLGPRNGRPVADATTPPAWSWDADRIMSVGAALYLAAAAVVLGRWLFGWAALRRLLRRCERSSGRARRLFAEMAGPNRRPRLLASRQARAPFSCGLLRPTVVLPAGLCEAPDEALRWVFAHELAHLRRRDAWSGLLFGLAQARLLPRAVVLAAAPPGAVVPGIPGRRGRRFRRRPARRLRTIPAGLDGRARPPVGARGVWGRSSDLFWRVKTMLQSPVPLERRCPRRWSMAAACGLLSLAVVGRRRHAEGVGRPGPRTEERRAETRSSPRRSSPPRRRPFPTCRCRTSMIC